MTLAVEEGLQFLSDSEANNESMNQASSLNEVTKRALTELNDIIDLPKVNTVPMANMFKKPTSQLLRDVHIMEQAIDRTLRSDHFNVRYLKVPCAMLSSTDCHSRSVSGHQLHVTTRMVRCQKGTRFRCRKVYAECVKGRWDEPVVAQR